MKRYLAAALACAFVFVSTGEQPAARADKPPSMRFEWRIEGPAEAIAELPENIIATDPAWH